MNTQNNMILDHLRKNQSITPLEALNLYGCMRLGARIFELRNKGYDIRSTMEKHVNGMGQEKRYARYWMMTESA